MQNMVTLPSQEDVRMADDAVAMARRTGRAEALISTLHSRTWVAAADGPDASWMLRDALELVALRPAPRPAPTGAIAPSSCETSPAHFCATAGEKRRSTTLLKPAPKRKRPDPPCRSTTPSASRPRWRQRAGGSPMPSGSQRRPEHVQVAGRRWSHSDTSAKSWRPAWSKVGSRRSSQRWAVSTDLGHTLLPWRTMLAGALADAGQPDRARAELDRLRDMGWHGLLHMYGSALSVRYLTELARRLDDPDRAATLLPQVRPWAGQMLVVVAGSSIEGASDRAIGHLLATLGRYDEADTAYAAGGDGASSRLPAAARPDRVLARPPRYSTAASPATPPAPTTCSTRCSPSRMNWA